MVPSFSTFNAVGGMFITGLFILAVWYTNTWNTGYLPINTNRIYDHYGLRYNVSRTIDERGMFDLEKYSAYSAPYMGAANALLYGFFFAIYSAVVTHVILYHRYEIMMGFKNLWKGMRFWKKKTDEEAAGEEGEYKDVHNRLMAAYPEGKSFGPVCPHLDSFTNILQFPSGGISELSSYLSYVVSSELHAGQHSPRLLSSCTAFGCASFLSFLLVSLLP